MKSNLWPASALVPAESTKEAEPLTFARERDCSDAVVTAFQWTPCPSVQNDYVSSRNWMHIMHEKAMIYV